MRTPSAAVGPGARVAWADVARGAVIILVVFAHAVQLTTAYGWSMGWLSTLNLYLTAVRMPLFFLVAGIFAVSAIRRPWRMLLATRIAFLVYLYLLWSIVRAIWFSVVPWPFGEMPPWLALLVSPVWPTSGLWFLYALILYTVLAKLTARLPRWLVLAAAAVISVAAAADVIPTGGNGVWRSIALYLFFFLLGVHGRTVLFALADRSRAWWAIPAALVVPAAMLVYSRVPGLVAPAARVILSVVCVLAVVVIAATVARARILRVPLTYIGTRTLPIYVVHTLLLAAVVVLIPVDVVSTPVVVVALTLLGVGGPLLLERLLRGVDGVFTLPRRLGTSLARLAEPKQGRMDP